MVGCSKNNLTFCLTEIQNKFILMAKSKYYLQMLHV